MGKLDLKSACAVMGFSCLWAYVQKGFLSTRLAWAPEGDFAFAAGALLSFLLVFVLVFAREHERIERALSARKVAFFGVLTAAIVTEVVVYRGAPTLSGLGAYAFCLAYYFLHALLLVSLFFAWMLLFMRIAYEKSLSAAIALLLVALIVSRIVTTPYLFIWSAFSREETVFLVAISGILWLACADSESEDELRFSAKISSSSLMKRYLPAFLLYLFGGIASRIVQSFAEDFWHMQVFNASREIICFVFLALCITVFFLPKKAREKFSRRDVFFMATGLVMGIVVGQLLGVNRTLPIEQLFFDFIETSRAILLVVSLLLVFLIVYEESVSPVVAFGLFVIGPIVIWRFFNLAAEGVGPFAVPDWAYTLLLVVVAVLFFAISVLFLFVFVGSNAFLTSFDGKRRERFERRALIASIAQEHGLTEREADVFEYLSMGYTAKRIGEKLYISPFTAQNHIRCIYAKLGVGSKQEVLEFIESQVKGR